MKSEKAWYQGVKLLLSEPIFVKRENHPVAILMSISHDVMRSLVGFAVIWTWGGAPSSFITWPWLMEWSCIPRPDQPTTRPGRRIYHQIIVDVVEF